MQTLLQISRRVSQWKNYENRPTSDEVIIKVIRVTFFETQCICMYRGGSTILKGRGRILTPLIAYPWQTHGKQGFGTQRDPNVIRLVEFWELKKDPAQQSQKLSNQVQQISGPCQQMDLRSPRTLVKCHNGARRGAMLVQTLGFRHLYRRHNGAQRSAMQIQTRRAVTLAKQLLQKCSHLVKVAL